MKLKSKEKNVYLKLAEELAELSVELLHAINKPRKENFDKILNDVKDVESYILLIKSYENEP